MCPYLSSCLSGTATDAARAFRQRFGKPAAVLAAAPGRVNLIGEHTDYSGGYVLPMTIDRWVVVAAAPPDAPGTRRIRAHSTWAGESVDIEIDVETGPRPPQWSNYVRGVVAGFRRLLVPRGGAVPAVDALIASDVPAGGGLSSSAALEVATAHLMELLTGLGLSPLERALLCQRAEHEYAGVPCGIMDQLVCAQGEDAGLLLIDCSTKTTRPIPWDDEGVTILISNTNVRHSLGDGAYAQRRAECEEAARRIGKGSLGEAGIGDVESAKEALGSLLYRRARHVVSENARTVKAAELLEIGDLEGVGALMYESHRSLRDDYEVSCSELDVLVEAACDIGKAGGVYGSRMTGGGFGGCTVTLMRTDRVEAVIRELGKRFEERTGRALDAFASRPVGGGRRIDVARVGGLTP